MVARRSLLPAVLYISQRLADVVVSASTSPEGFGRVVAEAQAMGRPVVATSHGGARETVVPGSTGWLVPPGDPRALAEGLAEALKLGPEERLAHAARAIEHVRRMALQCPATCGNTPAGRFRVRDCGSRQ